MKFVIDAKRWLSHISSNEVTKEPIKEVRLVDNGHGYLGVYINGREKPETHIEMAWEGGGERVFIMGDHEDYKVDDPKVVERRKQEN